MKKIRILGILLALGVFLGAFAPFSNADEWDKTTKVKFSEPVQVPGTVLPAGTYVFRLRQRADAPSRPFARTPF